MTLQATAVTRKAAKAAKEAKAAGKAVPKKKSGAAGVDGSGLTVQQRKIRQRVRRHREELAKRESLAATAEAAPKAGGHLTHGGQGNIPPPPPMPGTASTG